MLLSCLLALGLLTDRVVNLHELLPEQLISNVQSKALNLALAQFIEFIFAKLLQLQLLDVMILGLRIDRILTQ